LFLVHEGHRPAIRPGAGGLDRLSFPAVLRESDLAQTQFRWLNSMIYIPVMNIPRRFRLWLDRMILSLFPPFLCTGTRCTYVSPDYRIARMRLAKTFLTRNLHGSQFGGAIFAMTDPVHALMLYRILGPGHEVWNRSARIQFRRPGRTALAAEFRIQDEDLVHIRSCLAADGRAAHTFSAQVKGLSGEIVAEVEVEVFVRKVPE
jgi:acyl-coenzyme A thioesterase PaaI-like protein